MDMSIYRILHIIGILLLFQSLGAYLFNAMTDRASGDKSALKMVTRLHGLGLLLIAISGFGMLAKLQLFWPLPGWIWIMLIVWVLSGVSVFLVKKNPASARMWWILTIVFGVVTVLMGVLKPF